MYEQHIEKLASWFKSHQGTITAFSGGIDSTLVLYLSHKFLGDKGIGCISISPSLKRRDYTFAIDFCQQQGIHLEVIETQEIFDEHYNSNPSNRCYFCKNHLYLDLHKLQKQYPGYTVLNGTNTDDFGDYRPGLEAAKEFEVRSPLAECGLNKEDIRTLALYFGLPNWNKPASPCLSSRIPYGNHITEEKLKQVELAEEILFRYGFQEARVRHYGEEARIEVPADKLEQLKTHFDAIDEAIKGLGFKQCKIDQEGYVSGKLNRDILNQEAGMKN